MPKTGNMLDIHSLGKSFGKREVLKDLSFSLEAGEVLGFLGANGAGKSTTLRILLSLVKPDTGSFQLLGESFPGGSRKILSQTGALVERADLYPHLTARENLRMLGKLQGMRDARRVQEMLDLVGLSERADEPVKQFSQGMKQRLGLAQAILHRPRLLILDEPMTGLDPAGMRQMREWILRLAHKEGMAVLFSSHLLGEVEQLADRILVLHEGQKVAEGVPEDLFDRFGGSRWEVKGRDPVAMRAVIQKLLPDLDISMDEAGLQFRAASFPAEHVLHELLKAACPPQQFHQSNSLEELLLQVSPGDGAC